MTLVRIDLRNELKPLYSASSKTAHILEVPRMNYLKIDGSGDPNTAQEYRDAVSALYSVAYTLKFALKKREGIDYPVMALEGLWWVEDLAQLSMEDKSNWKWTMMIVQPDVVTEAAFEQAVVEVRKKKDPPLLDRVCLESFHEGLSAQIMHIGPYAAEAPTLARLYAFMEANGYAHNGRHHEIYLGDPRRSAPEKLKTIIRQPIAAKA
jgi:hypothetical protein